MIPFSWNNPTHLHFGEGCVTDLGGAVSEFGTSVLLMYGKGSIKRNGIYETVMSQLNRAGCRVVEYGGIKSNPVNTDVDAAAAVARSEQVDVILAVGGGSVIDSAKMTSIAIHHDGEVWDFWSKKIKPTVATPIITVLTLAATGSEMNRSAVLQNDKTKEKYGYGNPLLYPTHSFLDPAYTTSVPADYTAYGISDLIAHCLEMYFGDGNVPLTDRFTESIIAEAMEAGPQLMRDLSNVEQRGRIMWAATNALNGLTGLGRWRGDWGVHAIEHSLSVLFDIPHGAGLSIVYPAWMKHLKPHVERRLLQLGNRLFGVADADETIRRFEDFFTTIESPIRLSQAGIMDDKHDEIVDHLIRVNAGGAHFQFEDEEYPKLVELMA